MKQIFNQKNLNADSQRKMLKHQNTNSNNSKYDLISVSFEQNFALSNTNWYGLNK